MSSACLHDTMSNVSRVMSSTFQDGNTKNAGVHDCGDKETLSPEETTAVKTKEEHRGLINNVLEMQLSRLLSKTTSTSLKTTTCTSNRLITEEVSLKKRDGSVSHGCWFLVLSFYYVYYPKDIAKKYYNGVFSYFRQRRHTEKNQGWTPRMRHKDFSPNELLEQHLSLSDFSKISTSTVPFLYRHFAFLL